MHAKLLDRNNLRFTLDNKNPHGEQQKGLLYREFLYRRSTRNISESCQNHARQFQGIKSAFVKAYLIFVKMKKVKKVEEKIEKNACNCKVPDSFVSLPDKQNFIFSWKTRKQTICTPESNILLCESIQHAYLSMVVNLIKSTTLQNELHR